MDSKRFKKLLNLVVVSGYTKKSFWKSPKKFELQVYFTPVKNKIMIILIEGVEIEHSKLFVNFKVGDDIDLVYDWIHKYEHEIIFQRIRLQN
jgi:hypothetical protein